MRRKRKVVERVKELPADPDHEKWCDTHLRFVDRRPCVEPRCVICDDTYCGVCKTEKGHYCCPAHWHLEPTVTLLVLESTPEPPEKYVNNRPQHSPFARR